MFIETPGVRFQKDRVLFYDIKHLELVATRGHESKQQQEV